MGRDPERTRTEIMDAAEALVYEQGFAGASVSSIIDSAGVTKGAFFHHFPSKNDLARALVERFAAAEHALLDDALTRSERYSRDPVQRVMVFLAILEEFVESRPADTPPACLFASYCYQADLFDEETLEVGRRSILEFRERYSEMLRAAATVRPPAVPVDLVDLAEMLTVVFEGAYVVARTLRDSPAVLRHLRLYRTQLELLFGVESDEGEKDAA